MDMISFHRLTLHPKSQETNILRTVLTATPHSQLPWKSKTKIILKSEQFLFPFWWSVFLVYQTLADILRPGVIPPSIRSNVGTDDFGKQSPRTIKKQRFFLWVKLDISYQ